jgi:hypothetical protein
VGAQKACAPDHRLGLCQLLEGLLEGNNLGVTLRPEGGIIVPEGRDFVDEPRHVVGDGRGPAVGAVDGVRGFISPRIDATSGRLTLQVAPVDLLRQRSVAPEFEVSPLQQRTPAAVVQGSLILQHVVFAERQDALAWLIQRIDEIPSTQVNLHSA